MIEKLFAEKASQLRTIVNAHMKDGQTVRRITQTVWERLRLAETNGDLNSNEHAERLMHSIALNLIAAELNLDTSRTNQEVINDLGSREGDDLPTGIRVIFEGLMNGLTFNQIGKFEGVSGKCIGLRWVRYCRGISEELVAV